MQSSKKQPQTLESTLKIYASAQTAGATPECVTLDVFLLKENITKTFMVGNIY